MNAHSTMHGAVRVVSQGVRCLCAAGQGAHADSLGASDLRASAMVSVGLLAKQPPVRF